MGATFVVTLREAFEAALLLGIVYTYLDKIGARAQAHYVTIGGALGVVASVAMGVALTYLSGPLLDVGPDLVATVIIFGAVALLTWHGWWMRRHARAARGDIERRLEEARASRRLWVIGLIAFTGVFREGAETVLFINALATTEGGWSAGLFAGLAAATVGLVVLFYFINLIAQKIPLRPLFIITSAFLFAMAIKFIGEAVQEFQEQSIISVTEVKGSAFLSMIGLNPSMEALSIQGLVILFALATYSVVQRNNRLAREGKAVHTAKP